MSSSWSSSWSSSSVDLESFYWSSSFFRMKNMSHLLYHHHIVQCCPGRSGSEDPPNDSLPQKWSRAIHDRTDIEVSFCHGGMQYREITVRQRERCVARIPFIFCYISRRDVFNHRFIFSFVLRLNRNLHLLAPITTIVDRKKIVVTESPLICPTPGSSQPRDGLIDGLTIDRSVQRE